MFPLLGHDLVARQLLHVALGPVEQPRLAYWILKDGGRGNAGESLHVTHRNHADGLPDTEPDTGRDAPVQPLDAVLLVDVLESVANRHLLGPVGVIGLALHLDADDLDRLVPGAKTTTKRRRGNLLKSPELLRFRLARDVADPLLREPAEPEPRTPVRHLADGDGVDALVDTADALLAPDVHERGEGGLRLDARRRELVLGDLHRLHARAEAHGSVRLRHAARHAARDAASELGRAEGARVVLGLGGDEEEDSALGGRLDPGPRDETLVDCSFPCVSRALFYS